MPSIYTQIRYRYVAPILVVDEFHLSYHSKCVNSISFLEDKFDKFPFILPFEVYYFIESYYLSYFFKIKMLERNVRMINLLILKCSEEDNDFLV